MFRKKRNRLHKKRVSNRVGLEHQDGRVSLFWNTNMAAMTSCENAIYLLQTVNWFSITPWANVVFFLTFIVCANVFLNLSLCTNVARRKKWRRVNHWMTFLPHFDAFCDLFFFLRYQKRKKKEKEKPFKLMFDCSQMCLKFRLFSRPKNTFWFDFCSFSYFSKITPEFSPVLCLQIQIYDKTIIFPFLVL